MLNKTKGAKGNKVTKGATKTTGNVVSTPNTKGGMWLALKGTPAYKALAQKVGQIVTIGGKQANVTHVGAVQVNPAYKAPANIPVNAIIKLMQAGHGVKAGNTQRYCTLKAMQGRANKNNPKFVSVSIAPIKGAVK